jgi:hypothetical protein
MVTGYLADCNETLPGIWLMVAGFGPTLLVPKRMDSKAKHDYDHLSDFGRGFSRGMVLSFLAQEAKATP